jgi:spore maturation protein CgeB
LANAGVILAVKPSDVAGMRDCITHLLEHPDEAEAIAQRGYELVQQYYNSEQYVKALTEKLIALASSSERVLSYL